MPALRLPRALLLLGVAVAVGATGCDRAVPGSPTQAAAVAPAVDAAAAPAGRSCPSTSTLRAALPPDGVGGTYTLTGPVLCSGDWAVADPLYTSADPSGGGRPVSVTQLFHRVGDGWQPVDRAPLCADGKVPASISELTCDSN